MIRTGLFIVTVAAAIPAQDPAAAFIPPAHSCEITVDVKALRGTDLLDDLMALPLIGMGLKSAEKQMGFQLDDIDRIRFFLQLPTTPDDPGGMGNLTIIEGNAKLKTPDLNGEKGKIGAYDVVLDGLGDDPLVWATIKPGLMVCGTKKFVSPMLDGSQKPGRPDPKLQALGGAQGVAIRIAMHTKAELFGAEDGPFAAGELPVPTAAAIVLRYATEADGDQFSFDVVCQYADDADAATLTSAIKQMMMGVVEMPAAQPVKPLLQKLELEAKGKDAIARLPLGTSRETVATIGQVATSLLATRVARNVWPSRRWRHAIGTSEDAKLQKAKTDVTSIHNAAKLYYVYYSSIPTLEQLTMPDEKGRVAIDMLVADPWDQEYVIRELERNKFEVISFGPDREEGTADDITSRPDRER